MVTEDDIRRSITDFEYGYLTWEELIDWLRENGLEVDGGENEVSND